MPMRLTYLKPEEVKLLNNAVREELYASNFYKYAASCCQKKGYFGFQKFFEAEAKSETKHYYKLRDFMNDMNSEADMPTIEEVDFQDESVLGIFNASLQLEVDLGKFYNDFYLKQTSAQVQTFLIEMVNIQRESVGEYNDLIARLELCMGNPAAYLLIDQELGK